MTTPQFVIVALLLLLILLGLVMLWLRARVGATAEHSPLVRAIGELDTRLSDAFARANADMSARVEQIKGDLRIDLAERLQQVRETTESRFAAMMETHAAASRESRVELTGNLAENARDLGAKFDQLETKTTSSLESMRGTIETKLAALQEDTARKLESLKATTETKFSAMMETHAVAAKETRLELTKSLADSTRDMGGKFEGLETKLTLNLGAMRETVETKLSALQEDNTRKLEQMRATVDEKLHATLEQRLGESFKLVGERLEMVHAGLGEMRSLATGVGDLKKVLTNIRVRGTWGEVQLGNLLEQMLTPDQYEKNVATKPQSSERVEFAVKLPGRDEGNAPVWLPIDAKFPHSDYERLLDAQERGDAVEAAAAGLALEANVRMEAKKICEKYINPPHSTDFAMMFLPNEGLFAEVLRRPGLCDEIQRNHRVILTGPTTLSAVLSSLQMGFRTLAIEKRSSEVWNVLGAVKTEFGKFGVVLGKVQKKLQEATNTIDAAASRSRVLEKKLRTVQELPIEEAAQLLGAEGALDEEAEAPGDADENAP